jgi:hypothetical protein
MELESSVPFPQEPATGPYPEPDQYNPYQVKVKLSLCLTN